MAHDTRPNVILVHCHDLGRFVGSYGVPTVQTPAIDAFAGDGVLFEHAYCTAPQCSPSRASMYTGRYPHSTGVMGLTQPPFDWNMNPDERHVAGLLSEAGYDTVLVGIHHESRTGPDDVIAKRHGFDVVRQRGQRGEDVTELAIEQLERLACGERPFYLQVGYLEPHRIRPREREEHGYLGFLGDYITPDDELGVTVPDYLVDDPPAREEIAELQGAVSYLDQQIGGLLEAIRRLGLEEEAIVIFTTDHGLALPRAKCSLYDAGLEIALMVRCPARGWNSGIRRSELVSNVDIVPTLLEAAALTPAANVQGLSFLGLLDRTSTEPSPRDAVFGEFTYHLYYDPRRCVRTERHKLIVNFTVAPHFMDPSSSWHPRTAPIGARNGPPQFHPPVELYDLANDPLEMANLAEDPAHADVRRQLLDRLVSWMRDTDDPLLEGPVSPPLQNSALAALRGT